MPRSAKIAKQFQDKAKAALMRNRFLRQRDLADELLLSPDTIRKFFNGYRISCENFITICDRLGLNSDEIADFGESSEKTTPSPVAKTEGEEKPAPQSESNSSDRYYIERPPIEARCYDEICQPGALLRIKAPQGMGKTFLLTRILRQATDRGYRQVYLNLKHLRDELNDLDSFLRWFCNRVCRGLKLSTPPAEHFGQSRANNYLCKDYFEDCILPNIDSPLILGLDVVDRIFPYPIAVEFLSMLRSWHEEAKSYDIWNKFRLVMAYSTEGYIPIDVHRSPFNVGLSVELPEFTSEQVRDLAQRHALPWNAAVEGKILMDLVGGHPTLVALAMDKMSLQHISVEEVLSMATTPAGIYYHPLQRLWENLSKHPELMEVMGQIVASSDPLPIDSSEIAFKLHSMGLIELDKEGAIPRCELYRQYFRDRLKKE